MKATIDLEFQHVRIEEAFIEAKRIASILDVWCRFIINDVECHVNKLSNIEEGIRLYREEISNPNNLYVFC